MKVLSEEESRPVAAFQKCSEMLSIDPLYSCSRRSDWVIVVVGQSGARNRLQGVECVDYLNGNCDGRP